MVTVNEQAAVLPAASAAVTWTVVTPTEKKEPGGGTHEILVTPEQASTAVGKGKDTTAPHWLGSLPATILVGQESTGGVLSRTSTKATQLFEAPQISMAVRVTALVPKG